MNPTIFNTLCWVTGLMESFKILVLLNTTSADIKTKSADVIRYDVGEPVGGMLSGFASQWWITGIQMDFSQSCLFKHSKSRDYKLEWLAASVLERQVENTLLCCVVDGAAVLTADWSTGPISFNQSQTEWQDWLTLYGCRIHKRYYIIILKSTTILKEMRITQLFS